MTVTSRISRTSNIPSGLAFSWNSMPGACSGGSGKSSPAKRGARSRTQTVLPLSARRQAAMPPPNPEPTTTTSYAGFTTRPFPTPRRGVKRRTVDGPDRPGLSSQHNDAEGRQGRVMATSRSAHARAPRAAARWPVVVGWAFGLLLGVAALATLAYLVGHGKPFGIGTPLDEIAAAATKSGSAVAIALSALTAIAWCARNLLMERPAWSPGRIEVERFSAATDVTAAEIDQYTLSFRRRLSELRLQAPTGVPGAVPQRDFLDVLGAGGIDARNVLGSLLSIARAAKPTHAYEVNGVLLRRKAANGFGVTVQVVRLPARARVPVTVWDSSWEAAVRRAADSA